MANRLYIDEFKQEAANQIIKNGYPIKDTAQRLGVHPDSLKSWIKSTVIPKVQLNIKHQRTYHPRIESSKQN